MATVTPNPLAVNRTDRFPARPHLVFLHDSLGCITLWRDFPERLGAMVKCNTLVYDRQGYGASPAFATSERANDYMTAEAELLGKLLDQWQLEEVILFGHSDGGTIALLAAALFPHRIKAVITEGAHIFVEDITIQGIEQAALLYQTTDLKTRLEKYHGGNTEALFNAWTKTWLRPGFRTWNIERYLPLVSCPSLIIQGEEDEFGSIAQVEGIVNGTSGNATPLLLPGAKHTPHKEAPAEVFSHCAAFIAALN